MSDNSSSQRVAPGLSPQIIQSKIYQKNSKKTVLFFCLFISYRHRIFRRELI